MVAAAGPFKRLGVGRLLWLAIITCRGVTLKWGPAPVAKKNAAFITIIIIYHTAHTFTRTRCSPSNLSTQIGLYRR